ncbi:MAG: Rrf2 family transcriptional regulator [Flavobacteriaceae bacterium]|nr:Rrf2 family transcriptional regulator [Flavobacteriaceae bacterium]
MLTKSSKHAIRAVMYLVKNASFENKIGAKYIAKKLAIPAPFLAKTLQVLAKKEIITSIKGPKGGFYLTPANNKKTIYDIINSVDNVNKIEQCYLGQNECNDRNPCAIHHLYKPFKISLLNNFKTKTIIDFAKDATQQNKLLLEGTE